MAGYGTFPPAEKFQPLPEGVDPPDLAAVERLLTASTRNFADYRAG